MDKLKELIENLALVIVGTAMMTFLVLAITYKSVILCIVGLSFVVLLMVVGMLLFSYQGVK